MIRSTVLLLLVCMVVVGSSGCGADEVGPFTQVADDDPEIVAARREARDSIDRFYDALRRPASTQRRFAVQKAFDTDGEPEWLWVRQLTLDGDRLNGVVDTEPTRATQFARGTAVTIDRADVDDWMYLDGTALVGAYTIRVSLARQTAAQREAFEIAWGVDLEATADP